ncbi:MAG: hypothetical protein V3U96_04120 [Paracoccaceae bacterium]
MIKFYMSAAIAALALFYADPAFSDPSDPSAPSSGGGGSSSASQSSGGSGTSFSLGSTSTIGQFESSFNRTQEELSRLFVMSDAEIAAEFPNGGFDEALVRAANRARRAERAYLRRK